LKEGGQAVFMWMLLKVVLLLWRCDQSALVSHKTTIMPCHAHNTT